MDLNLDWQRRQSVIWPEVSYELRPLRVWAFQELLALWERQPATAADGAQEGEQGAPRAGELSGGGRSLAATAQLVDAARRILPEHVRNLSGLTVHGEAGSGPAQVSALCEETLLLPLAAELVTRLIELSSLDGASAKN